MEMVLHTKELGLIDMWVEERDGVGLKVALLLGLLCLVGVERVVESISLFVELH